MKRLKKLKNHKVTNWLHHKETRDDIWDYMATKWATRAERLSSYGRQHLPAPVKAAIKSTIHTPKSVVDSIRNKRDQQAEQSKHDQSVVSTSYLSLMQ